MYDFAASLQRLSVRINGMRESDWSPTEEVKRLKGLAADLEGLADRMGAPSFVWLEQAYDADEPTCTWLDGYPIAPSEPRAGRFAALQAQMIELAAAAKREAENLPNPRRREYLDYCADVFLHISNECGMPRPALYDKSEAVTDFAAVCEKAGIALSPERMRGLLAAAMDRFDSNRMPEGLAQFLVMRR